jgi:hypothetical protein
VGGRTWALAMTAVLWLAGAQPVLAQSAASGPLTDDDLRSLLVWSSPWEGRAKPPEAYSYRTVFRQRRDALIAETTSYTTNQRSDSVVSVAGGRVNWQDSNGAEVNVAPAETGDLVGTATSPGRNLSITFKPRR